MFQIRFYYKLYGGQVQLTVVTKNPITFTIPSLYNVEKPVTHILSTSKCYQQPSTDMNRGVVKNTSLNSHKHQPFWTSTPKLFTIQHRNYFNSTHKNEINNVKCWVLHGIGKEGILNFKNSHSTHSHLIEHSGLKLMTKH